ncbi:HNH endonuclease signature motif containing protein [Actinotalea sp. JY-7876]|uniref:HNH endonuclease signature motif containing protein n=1 Tax=Actinotalea sp. JY-7876 TaxID=2758442 RepID=UPI0015F6A2D1|nr:HNH endonuclease signature motif containing protein [Actinotalea sp. JY-7876]
MITELGSTTDPKALVQGSAPALHADADDLDRDATTLRDAASRTDTLVVTNWAGQAADAHQIRREDLAKVLTGVADIYDMAAGVLRNHAGVVTWGQAEAQTAIDLYEQGCNSWGTTDPQLVYSPRIGSTGSRFSRAASDRIDLGVGTRASAQHILENARTQVTESALAAKRILDDLSDGLPDGRWHTDQFLAGVGDWLTGLATLTVKYGSVRAVVDPRGSARDFEAAFEGYGVLAEQAVDDPVGAGRALLDVQTLEDNPGRWWGAVAPDLAISAATAGGGAAAGALSRAGRGGRLVENAADAAAAGTTAPTILNRLGQVYPSVLDARTGAPIHYPGDGLQRVAATERVLWNTRTRAAYIAEWRGRGFEVPPEGWAAYDIHHVQPRLYGGSNSFDNLVPVLREVHRAEFNPWWEGY